MRPVSLEIAGLHSFRNRRVIDFTPLLKDNLFGIFGPTGSGKSTILDAITLALFGEVKRADRKTHGIVNVLEDECTVSFVFDIERDGERKRFRAERLFKKSESGGAATKRARLIELGEEGEDVPLADKEKEMTALVEEILGIRADDFRLSVVLPQGAFADFLHLRAKDRGAMLQRIFGLESLGEKINSGLREIRKRLESTKEKIEERLAQLKAYDNSALRDARKEAKAATEQLRTNKKSLTAAEKAFKEAEELYGLITEFNTLKTGEESRAREREKLNALQKQVALAEHCLNLETIVSKAATAQARYQNARKEYEETVRVKQEAEELITPLRPRVEWAEAQRHKETGRLIVLLREIETLKQAADREERIIKLEQKSAERENAIQQKEKQRDAIIKRDATAKDAEENAKKALVELGTRVETLGQKREKLLHNESSISLLERLASEKQNLAEGLEKLKKNIASETTKQKNAVAALQKKRGVQQEQEGNLKELRNRYDEARLGRALAEAADSLQAGEPCPLCGSIEHPHPFHPEPDTTETIARHIAETEAQLKTTSETVRTLEREEATLSATLQSLAAQSKDIEGRITKIEEEIRTSVVESGYKGETDFQTLSEWKQKLSTRLAETTTQRQEAVAAQKEFEQKLTQAGKDRSKTQAEIAGLTSAIEADKQELEQQKKELESEAIAYKNLLAAIESADSATPLSNKKATEHLQERVEEKERLEKEVERIEREYATVKEKLNEATTRYNLHFSTLEREEKEKDGLERERDHKLKEEGFAQLEDWEAGYMKPAELASTRSTIAQIETTLKETESRAAELQQRIANRTISEEETEQLRSRYEEASTAQEESIARLGAAESSLKLCEQKNTEWNAAIKENETALREFRAAEKLTTYLRGNAFINFLADERLQHICQTASKQLLDLTGGRLEVGTASNEGFFIRDNGNGGQQRPPTTLSGGETFLVSLALSLALSDSLRVGRAPLEFFFLDEGFGTLDSELLETVMDSVDRLRISSHRAIGVISHVRELQERIPRRLVLTAATESSGSDLRLEIE